MSIHATDCWCAGTRGMTIGGSTEGGSCAGRGDLRAGTYARGPVRRGVPGRAGGRPGRDGAARAGAPQRGPGRRGGRRAARAVLPQRGGARRGPGRRAGRGAAGPGTGAAIGPALRVGTPSGPGRGDAGDDRVADLVITGGVESMSQAEFYAPDLRWGPRGESVTLVDRLARARVTAGGRDHPVPGGMLETAENLRREYRISRREQDELAARSHRRAVAAQRSGVFAEEIVPVPVSGRPEPVTLDEHPRADSTVEALARLRPVRLKEDPEATVTAGNASGQNDGAAACLVTTPEGAARLGLTPFARVVSWAVAGVPPRTMGVGPVPATAKALARAGLKLADMDLIELNEAFAAQVLAVTREWGLPETDHDRLNVHGSGISLGHPVGATGARILATLLREMRRRDARYGLETMCIGGGQGLAAVFERTP